MGNAFTIFVFWTQRFHLTRTCFLLIKLAVADFLVGVTEPIVLGTEKIRKMTAVRGQINSIKSPSSTFQVLGSSASVFFLAIISLERVFAVLCPLRHRVISHRAYIYSIITGWAAGVCMAGISLLQKYETELGRNVYGGVVIHSCLFISVLVICASYLTVRTRLHSATPERDVNVHNSTEHNLRLSRTFFIVVAVSSMCFSTWGVDCKCSALGKFYGESIICIQL
jgi:hypothetical protein